MKSFDKELSNLNHELKEKNFYLAGILDATVNIVILRDKDKKLLYINKQFSNYFPDYKSLEDFDREHDSISELFDSDDESYIDEEYYSKNFDYIATNDIEYKTKISYKNNQTLYFKLTITKSQLESSKGFFVIILADITKLELEKQKNIEQERMLQQQAKMASLGEMIGNIAHQWRQPLNALSSLIVLHGMKHRTKGLTESDMLQLKVKSNYIIQNMSKTIDDFKNFFSPKKEKERFCIRDAITETTVFVESSYLEYNIELVNRVDKNIEIVCYKNELEQVFLNIFNNSKDAIKGNIEDIVNPVVSIDVVETKNMLKIEIADNGGGIDPKIIDRVFEPYFSTKFESNGTGIGLYMSKMIVEGSMGGRLLLENRDDGVVAIIELFPNNR